MSKRTPISIFVGSKQIASANSFSGIPRTDHGVNITEKIISEARSVVIGKLSKQQVIGSGKIGNLFGVKFYMSPPWISEMMKFSNRWHRAHRWQVKIGFKLLSVARGEPLTMMEMLEKDFGVRP